MNLNVNMAAVLASLGCLSILDNEELGVYFQNAMEESTNFIMKKYRHEACDQSLLERIRNEVREVVDMVGDGTQFHNNCRLDPQVHRGVKVMITRPTSIGLEEEALGSEGFLEPHFGPFLQIVNGCSVNPIVIHQDDAILGNVAVCSDQPKDFILTE